jgi:hypothetical protein
MTIDEFNALCAEIASEEAERRVGEYADFLEEEELMFLMEQYNYSSYDDETGPWYWEIK